MEKIENIKSVEEISDRLLELAKDIDFMDYEDEQEQIKSDLENMLYWIKTAAQNEYNKDYFRTFYNILQRI